MLSMYPGMKLLVIGYMNALVMLSSNKLAHIKWLKMVPIYYLIVSWVR